MKKRTKTIVMALLLLSLSIFSSFSVSAAETAFIPEERTYMLRNLGSGKYLNVDNGIDTDGTNVYQWSSDGSIEQKFKFEYDSGSWYRIQAVCSSNGNNRCLSISGATSTVSNNSNVVLNTANNNIAQHFTIHSAGSKTVVLKPRYNSNLALTAYGTSNGSATGTTSSSAGKSTGPHLHLCMWIDDTDYASPSENNCFNPQRFYPLLTFTGATSTLP